MPGSLPYGLEVTPFSGSWGGILGNGYTEGLYIPPNTTINTKGAWTQIFASTNVDSSWMEIFGAYANANNGVTCKPCIIDVGVGGAGVEQVVVQNLMFSSYGQFTIDGQSVISFPLSIPAGSRVSIRSQLPVSETSSNNHNDVNFGLNLFAGSLHSMDGCGGVDAIGVNTATTKGTTFTPAQAAKGSYTPITAATTRDYIGLFWRYDNNDNYQPTNFAPYYVDIAIGAGGSEKIIFNDDWFVMGTAPFGGPYGVATKFLPTFIPAGTRIAVRAQAGYDSSGATYAPNTYNISVYGVYQ